MKQKKKDVQSMTQNLKMNHHRQMVINHKSLKQMHITVNKVIRMKLKIMMKVPSMKNAIKNTKKIKRKKRRSIIRNLMNLMKVQGMNLKRKRRRKIIQIVLIKSGSHRLTFSSSWLSWGKKWRDVVYRQMK